MDWIIHLDTDELIYPAGNREYSLRQLLSDVPGNVDMVIFPNYVSKKVLCRFRFFSFFSFMTCHMGLYSIGYIVNCIPLLEPQPYVKDGI